MSAYSDLTVEEKVTNFETSCHMRDVTHFINIFIKELMDRAEKHDLSKLEYPEVPYFTKQTSKLAALAYGTKEYDEQLKELKPALDHHYAKNRHHPAHFPNGINDMNLVDILEMFADWKSSTLRQHAGNLLKSISINSRLYGIDSQLTKILENTAKLFE